MEMLEDYRVLGGQERPGQPLLLGWCLSRAWSPARIPPSLRRDCHEVRPLPHVTSQSQIVLSDLKGTSDQEDGPGVMRGWDWRKLGWGVPKIS